MKKKLKITWRLVFYLLYLVNIMFWIIPALYLTYVRFFATSIFLMICLSWPVSIYLIKLKIEEE